MPNGAPRFGLWVDAVRFARDQTSLLARTSANALRCVRPTSGYLISVAYIRVAWEWGREPNFRYSLRRSSNWVRWSGSLPLYKPYICKHCGPSSKTGPQCGRRAQARPSGAAVIGIHWTTLKKRVSVGGSRATRGREAHKDRSLRIANYVSHPPEGCWSPPSAHALRLLRNQKSFQVAPKPNYGRHPIRKVAAAGRDPKAFLSSERTDC